MNLTNILKKGIITIAIIALGLIFFLACGFNKSFDYTGGTIAEINITTNTESDAISKAKSVLAEHSNVTLYSISSGTEQKSDDKCIVIKFNISSEKTATNSEIENELYAAFGYDKSAYVKNITLTTSVGPAFNTSVFTYALIGVLVGAVAVSVYLWLRHGFASAITVFAGTIIDTVFLLAILAIFRLNISSYTGFAILAIAILSMIFNSLMISKLKENAIKEANLKKLNFEVANITRREVSKRTLLGLIAAGIVILVLTLITYSTAGSALFAMFITLISIFMTSLYILPSLWSLAYARKIKAQKKKSFEPMMELEN